jgi:gas vesicle protein
MAIPPPGKTRIDMNDGTTKGLLGFVLGAALGAAAGILLAPASGQETRRRIARKVQDTQEDLDELIERGRAEWSKAKGRAADAAQMTKEEVSDFIRFLFDEGKDLRSRLHEEVAETKDEVADQARKAANKVRHNVN